MFSKRAHWDLTPNPLASLRAAKDAAGVPVLDLTISNPTQAHLPVPDARLLDVLADPRALIYEPAPLGLPAAREAIARYYAGRGVGVDPAHIVLTASTSESYGFLFKLLCGAGDRVLVPTPSYPLFEYLAGLELVAIESYSLHFHLDWGMDIAEIEQLAGPPTRALLVVNPNNPTGSYLDEQERELLVEALAGSDVALISDEVFADYPAGPDPRRVESLVEEDRVPTFVLGGFSKLLGLPQLKLGWIVVNGPRAVRDEALRRLALIADTYLSVNTPVQIAVAALLERLPELRGRIAERVARNRAALAQIAAPPTIRLGAGGWSALLELPHGRNDEEWALYLLERHDVVVHPGYLFGFERDSMAVVSLLTPEDRLSEGMARIGRACATFPLTPHSAHL